MLASFFSNLSHLEAVWISTAVIGLIVTVTNLWDAMLDRAVLIKLGIGNGRRKIANVAIFTESTRVLIHAIFLTIGLLAATYPDPPREAHLSWTQQLVFYVVRWGLIAASVLLVTQSISLRWLRHQLRGD